MKRPHWDLKRVKELAEQPNGLFIQISRARTFLSGNAKTATEKARATIAALTEREFAETVTMTWDIADVYGVLVEGAGWYLKITIDESIPEVAVISFHPLERPLKTNKGAVKP